MRSKRKEVFIINQRSKGVSLLVVILLIGFIMRSPITTPPLLLGHLANQLQVHQSQLGILTTLPLVMFMLFSNFAAKPIMRFGLKRALLYALLAIVLGSALRMVMTMPTMILGTIFIGIGIAHLNVFMPSLVSAYFPNKIGLYTTLYSFAMIFGNMLFNLITAPISNQFGWQTIILILLLIPIISCLSWLLISRVIPEKIAPGKPTTGDQSPRPKLRLWTNPKAWPFLLTFGGQATLSYTVTAWMPALMEYHHVSAGHAGIVMAIYAFIGLPVSIILPNILTNLSQRYIRLLTIGAGLVALVASGLLFFQHTRSMFYWSTEAFLIGLSIGFFFITIMTMFVMKTKTPYETAQLSGMAQAGGYCMSAFGPSLYGLAFAANPAGNIQNICYLILALIMFLACWRVVKTETLD